MALQGSDDVTRYTTVYNSHFKMNLLKLMVLSVLWYTTGQHKNMKILNNLYR
jgi:hypothetical protein